MAIHLPSLTKVAIQCLGLQYNCLAIQLPCNTIVISQYNFPPYATIQSDTSCNTKMVLQYNFHYNFFFQPSLLQYKTKVCNTKIFFSQYNLGNSPKTVSALNLFFIYLFIFSFISTRDTKKNYIHFFFNTSIKFIKIYFYSFFFNFTHCKTLRKIFLLINFLFFISSH